LSDEAGSGLHDTRCSDRHEDHASLQRVVNPIQFERHLAEPADVRANPTAAFAPVHFGWRIVEICIVKWSAAATVATAPEKLSVHVDNFPRTRLLVKIVHVLSAGEEAVLQAVFKCR
jgi:hypothetical protein